MPLSYLTDGRLRATVELQDDAGNWTAQVDLNVTAEIVDVAGATIVGNIPMPYVPGASAYQSAVLFDAGLKKGRTYRAIVDADGGPGKHWHGELEFPVELDS